MGGFEASGPSFLLHGAGWASVGGREFPSGMYEFGLEYTGSC
jgi:hypothetical protein